MAKKVRNFAICLLIYMIASAIYFGKFQHYRDVVVAHPEFALLEKRYGGESSHWFHNDLPQFLKKYPNDAMLKRHAERNDEYFTYFNEWMTVANPHYVGSRISHISEQLIEKCKTFFD